MPWKSTAQARWGHSPSGIKALGGKDKVAEWDKATHGKKLPDRIRNPRLSRIVKKARKS